VAITDYSIQLWILRKFENICGASYLATMALNGCMQNNALFTPSGYEKSHNNSLRVIANNVLENNRQQLCKFHRQNLLEFLQIIEEYEKATLDRSRRNGSGSGMSTAGTNITCS
jgi:hypothetical protein